MAQSKIEARHLLLAASATSPRESFGFQCGAAETLHSRVFGAYHQVEPREQMVVTLPSSDEEGGKTAGFDGRRELRKF